MTEQEKFIKKTFLSPLKDKDRSAWKLGSLNEGNVRGITKAVAKGVDCVLVDMWECGLLRNKSSPWLATSRDGWLRLKMKGSTCNQYAVASDNSDSDDHDDDLERSATVNCGLEIKTPSGSKVLREKVQPAKECHGFFSTCAFGDQRFKQLVYQVDCRSQILHHATAANLDFILFIVASETGARYATLIHIRRVKRDAFHGILRGVYNCCLKWAYVDAWDSPDPVSFIPDIRPDVISSAKYPIDHESLCVSYCIWKSLFKMIHLAQLPLPIGMKIVPVIVSS